MEYAGFSESQAEEAVAKYRERYTEKGILRMRFTRESLSCFSYAGTGDECLASRPPNRRCLLSRS